MSATHGEQPDGRPCTSRGTAARGREEPRFPVRMLSFSRGSSSNHEVPRKSRYSPRSPQCAADPSPAVSPRGFARAGVRLVKAPREMYISCAAPTDRSALHFNSFTRSKTNNMSEKILLLHFFVFENLKNTVTKCGKWPAFKVVRGSERARGTGRRLTHARVTA